MAGVSKNKYDVYNWIKQKVIPSSEKGNIKHYLACDKLIYNFSKIYGDYELTIALRKLNRYKASNLINNQQFQKKLTIRDLLTKVIGDNNHQNEI